MIAVGLSVIGFVDLGLLCIWSNISCRAKSERLEDFLKIDKDIEKRKELSIETC